MSKTTDPNLVDALSEACSHRPLLDQNGRFVRYQIFLNRSEFEYIWQNGYDDAVNQYAAFQPGGEFAGFPNSGQPDDFVPPVNRPGWARQGTIVGSSWTKRKSLEDASPCRRCTTPGTSPPRIFRADR